MPLDLKTLSRWSLRVCGAAALLVAGASWAAETPGQAFGALDYSPPKFERSGKISETVFGSRHAVFDRALAALNAGEFTVLGHDTTDEISIITGYYSGEAQRFVDCGIVAVLDKRAPGRLESFGGAKGWAVYGVLEAEEMYIIDRQSQLHARIVVTLTPNGSNTRAEIDIQYVLANVTDAYLMGNLVGTRVETLEFTSDSRSRSDSGMLCVPTGNLEALTLQLIR